MYLDLRGITIRMSRRETSVNVLLGLALVLISALLFSLVVIALGFVLYAVDTIAKHYSSSDVASSRLEFFTLLLLVSLVSGVGHLRKRFWPNAFVSFAIMPVIASIWFAGAHSPLQFEGFSPAGSWLLIVLIPNRSRLERYEFGLAGFIVSATVAVNFGLFGAGSVARFVADSILLAVSSLFVVQTRRGGNEAPTGPALSGTSV